MMPQFYYNSLYRQDPSQGEEPIVPIEEKDDIFDNNIDDDNRNQQYPVGTKLGANSTPASPSTMGVQGIQSTTGTQGAMTPQGTIATQGTTTPSVTLPSTCGGGAPSIDSIEYTQGYLKTQIGKRVRAQFLLGTGTFQDRTGILLEVGISYIILRNEETNTNVLCDIYSIKFVDFF